MGSTELSTLSVMHYNLLTVIIIWKRDLLLSLPLTQRAIRLRHVSAPAQPHRLSFSLTREA